MGQKRQFLVKNGQNLKNVWDSVNKSGIFGISIKFYIK